MKPENTIIMLLAVSVVALICLAVGWYTSLPIVAKNAAGDCVWMDNRGDREPCPNTLPKKYITIPVP